ncbi:MAG TPA: SOS response-associated peptidase [Candidatus Limnocylindrales bacterium]|nr:SOS response-associated peptidase [Candidatus Limnocylindrales bacterium]
MCGRFTLTVDPEQLALAFGLTTVPEYTPRYNLAPTQDALVITADQPSEAQFMRWGLIPSWSKDASIGSKLINARAETAAEKPSFRNALRRRRCIVPASGFFEWQARAGGKQPLYITVKDAPVIGLAGLWEIWRDPAGEDVRTFTILTTEANAFMKQFHERMPVILQRDDYPVWMDRADVPAPVLQGLLTRVFEPEALQSVEVSKLVNKPSIDAPECIAPLSA